MNELGNFLKSDPWRQVRIPFCRLHGSGTPQYGNILGEHTIAKTIFVYQGQYLPGGLGSQEDPSHATIYYCVEVHVSSRFSYKCTYMYEVLRSHLMRPQPPSPATSARHEIDAITKILTPQEGPLITCYIIVL